MPLSPPVDVLEQRAEQEGVGAPRRPVEPPRSATVGLVRGSFETRSLREQTYELLRRKIVSGDMVPGEQIDIDRIATELRISRTPVKDSLNRLAAEGLVEVVPRRGTFVARFSSEQLLESLQVRMMLEVGAAPVATAALTQADLTELTFLVSEMHQLTSDLKRTSSRIFRKFSTLDYAFHSKIVGLAQNAQLNEIYARLDVHLQVARSYDLLHESDIAATHTEHAQILASLVRRDTAELQESLSNHIARVRRFMSVSVQSSTGVPSSAS